MNLRTRDRAHRPRHGARDAATRLLFVLCVCTAVVVVAAAAAAAAADVGAAPDGHVAIWSTIAAPRLEPVAPVARNTVGPVPPMTVEFDGEPVEGLTSADGATSAGVPGEVVIPGAPGYMWRHGCGPTAVGMVVGYWDGHGWDELIPGDATTQTAAVNQAIASDAGSGASGHYEDYALPKETSFTILPDLSQPPAGDEHASNCVADFMHASWSLDGLHYGESVSTMIAPAFTEYVRLKYSSSSPVVRTYEGPDLTWELVRQEVEGGRPMVFEVDSSGDAWPDHAVTVVGYREINGMAEYACWDTWNSGLLRWEQFRPLSSDYAWGVWGGTTFTIGAAGPTPEPTPTPTPTPTPETDTTPPVTTVGGADDLWHRTSVTLTMAATDDASGVAYTEYSLDGTAWVRGTALTLTLGRRAVNSGVHTVAYRSADQAGNLEAERYVQVKLDGKSPYTARSSSTGQAGAVLVQFSPSDSHSGVAATYYAVDGRDYKQGLTAQVSGKGTHTVSFYSLDVAGNKEAARSFTVTVK